MAGHAQGRAGRVLGTGLLSVVLLASALWALHARADEVSGTWTGEVEARGNYYLERSTRVMIPTGRVGIETPNGIRFNASYLVDVIASASIAAGPMGDNVFTELRHGVGTGVGKTFTLGDNELDLGVYGQYSTENDYKSIFLGLNSSFSWNEKNSALSLGLSHIGDRIYSTMDDSFRGELEGWTVSAGFSQVLSPVLTMAVGYQFVFMDGYLGNPYRRALIGPLPRAEAPPPERVRHNWEAQLSWFLPPTGTTLQAYARFYDDSWDLQALTPELRVFQSLGPNVVLRLRYRYYTQTRADFALRAGETSYPQGYTGYLTDDPKLSNFQSHQAGVRLSFALSAFTGTFLDFASRVVLDVAFDRQWCTSAFGNNITGTLGGRIPF